jgi:hypothetical protein
MGWDKAVRWFGVLTLLGIAFLVIVLVCGLVDIFIGLEDLLLEDLRGIGGAEPVLL